MNSSRAQARTPHSRAGSSSRTLSCSTICANIRPVNVFVIEPISNIESGSAAPYVKTRRPIWRVKIGAEIFRQHLRVHRNDSESGFGVASRRIQPKRTGAHQADRKRLKNVVHGRIV